MLKPNAARTALREATQELVDEFKRAGGRVRRVAKLGVPKDLERMKKNGWLFGGRRTFVATMHKRQDSAKGEMFGTLAKPMARGRKLAYDFA